ncbi:CDP-alcohol phosphatidyltransferase family protein [Affinirhizobium pseudoryzae]|uniref:CDP-alcohol phosphatidyltransferase family protein n=1 Tax=Allorhizobium pseudoryzae TaxID=379684 RepID=UPI001F3DDF0E|nr:CDP-alcohol phosphatidyltransferase family protein [Allorhizobium pseudoryzae]
MAALPEMSEQSPGLRPDAGKLLASTLKALCCAYGLSVAVWAVAALHLPIELHVPLLAALILAVMFGFVLYGLPNHDHPRFGYANLVTAIRAGLVSLIAATILSSSVFAAHEVNLLLWSVFGATVLALSLDGVDGYLARRFRQQSRLGARFDMEVDAFLILMLSIGCAVLGKAGLWVVLIGLMRYGFILAQWLLPKLRQELFPSLRRKIICVVQVAALCLVILPGFGQPASGMLSALCLALLVYSFAVDTIWLLTRKDSAP